MSDPEAQNGPDFEGRPLPLRGLELPAEGSVHVWFIDLAALGSPMLSGVNDLSPRQRRASRRFYLRLLLGAYLGLPGKDVMVLRTDRGKPTLDPSQHDTALQFSMAASGNFCLVGVCTSGLIGVDLETVDRSTGRPLGLANRYFSAAEASALAEVAPDRLDEAFLHTWALKEAVVKAGGQGIANELCRFTVSTDPDQPPRMQEMPGDAATDWHLAFLKPDATHLVALAVCQPALDLQCFNLEPVRAST